MLVLSTTTYVILIYKKILGSSVIQEKLQKLFTKANQHG